MVLKEAGTEREMKPKRFEHLILENGRRQLTARERAELERHFQKHPGDRELYEQESELDRLLDLAPQVKASDDFTSKVLDRVRDESQETLSPVISIVMLVRSHLKPLTAAAAGVALVLTLLTVRHRDQHLDEVANSLSTMAGAAPFQTLADFEEIHALGQFPAQVDEELLLALD